jgi:tetratricopeptide (TPR) repeat protein
MRLVLTGGVFVTFILCLAVPAVPAQQGQPAPEPEEETRLYVPPPAWKSVEIGDFYLKRKRFRAALSRYQEAVKTDPYYAQGYLGLGKVYDRLGLRQKALDAYRKYLDLLPSAKDAEEAKEVHKAIARLERQLKTSKQAPRTSSSSGIAAPPPR